MHLDLTSLDPRTTIHQIKLVLTQVTTAGTLSANPGEEDKTEYTMFTAGSSQLDPVTPTSTAADYVWRGEIPRQADAVARFELDTRRGSHAASTSNIAPKPLLKPAYADKVSETSISMSPLCRLPTPVIGAHATSPTILDPRLSRTSHSLRYEVIFSVLGEASPGVAMPDHLHSDRIPEGAMRRFWVDHPLVLGSCMMTPDNTIVPQYSPCPDFSATTHADYLDSIAARSEPKSFQIPHTRRIWPEGQTLNERTRIHLDDTAGSCACVFGDEVVRELVGRRTDRTWLGRNGDGDGEGAEGAKAAQLESVSVQRADDLQ